MKFSLVVVVLILAVTDGADTSLNLTATGVVDGVSVLRCSLSPVSRRIQDITWSKLLTPTNPQTVYFDTRVPQQHSRKKGKYGQFSQRNVIGHFGGHYHDLIINDSTLSDNSTSFMCAIREEGSKRNENSRGVLLSLMIPPNTSSVILDDKDTVVTRFVPGNSEVPVISATLGEKRTFICQSGGQRPAAEVHWTHNGTAKIDDIIVNTYFDKRYNLNLEQVQRRVVVNVTENSTRLNCTVLEVNPKSGSTRNVTKSFILHAVMDKSADGRCSGNCLLVSLLLLAGVPAVMWVLQMVMQWKDTCIIEMPQTCTAIVVRTFGHIPFGGALAAMICIGKTPQIAIGTVLSVVIFIHLVMKLTTLLKIRGFIPNSTSCLGLLSPCQGVKYWVWVLIGCGEVRYLQKKEADADVKSKDIEAMKPLTDKQANGVNRDGIAPRCFADSRDKIVQKRCLFIFFTDLMVSLLYVACILWVVIDEKCSEASVIPLMCVVLLGCTSYPVILCLCFRVLPSDSTNEEHKIKRDDPTKKPWEKKQFDAVIFFTENHYETAVNVKQSIVKNVKPASGGPPRLILWKNDPEEGNIVGRQLELAEKALEKSTFAFILVTEDYAEDDLANIFKEETIQLTIEDAQRRNCVIPLYTRPKGDCEIPFGLKSVMGINVNKMTKHEFSQMANVLNSKPRPTESERLPSSDDIDEPRANPETQMAPAETRGVQVED